MSAYSEIYKCVNRKFEKGLVNASAFNPTENFLEDEYYVRRGEFVFHEYNVSIGAAEQMMGQFRNESRGQSFQNHPLLQDTTENGKRRLKIIVSSTGLLFSVFGPGPRVLRQAYLQNNPEYGVVVLGALIFRNSTSWRVLVGRSWNCLHTPRTDTEGETATIPTIYCTPHEVSASHELTTRPTGILRCYRLKIIRRKTRSKYISIWRKIQVLETSWTWKSATCMWRTGTGGSGH